MSSNPQRPPRWESKAQRLLAQGEITQAMALLDSELRRARSVQIRFRILLLQATLLRRLERPAEALAVLRSVERETRRQKRLDLRSDALRQQAFIHYQAAGYERARHLAQQALKVARDSRSARAQADACAMMAHTFEPSGRLGVALAWLDEADGLAVTAKHGERRGTVRSDKGRLKATLGRYEEALQDLKSAGEALGRGSPLDSRLDVRLRQAAIYTALEDWDRARVLLRDVLRATSRRHLLRVHLEAESLQAELCLRRGNIGRAAAIIDRVLSNPAARPRLLAFARSTHVGVLLAAEGPSQMALAELRDVQTALNAGLPGLDVDLLRSFSSRLLVYAVAGGHSYWTKEVELTLASLTALIRDEGVYRSFEHEQAIRLTYESLLRSAGVYLNHGPGADAARQMNGTDQPLPSTRPSS